MEPTKVQAVRHEYFKLEEPTEQPKGDPNYPRYETHPNGHRVLISTPEEHAAFAAGTADGASVASHPMPDAPASVVAPVPAPTPDTEPEGSAA